MEAIGIRDSYEESDDDRALEHFNETVKFENGRYHVKMPWKEEQPDLPENRELAYCRLKTLVQKLSKNPDLLEKYNAIIEEQRRREIIEQLTDTSEVGHKRHYIPHHAVINPMKTSTKVRIVYDASAKVTKDSKNLNECLYRGPVMLKDLCGLLLHFRLNKVAMVADIEKAFLQVGLQAPDKDITRFFWLKDCKIPRVDGNLQIYRFCRIPFGVISSPFLLAATLDHHLKKDGSEAAQKIRDNIYVDNVITGTDAPQSAYNFYTEAKKIFSNASMNLREWTSNSELLLNRIPEHDQSRGDKIKVLGSNWHVKEDTMTVPGPEIEKLLVVSTKQEALQSISSIFNPLGFFTPVTLNAKLFLQSLWKAELNWDGRLDKESLSRWKYIAEQLQLIPSHSFPRFIGTGKETTQVKYQLMCFSDTSTRAYSTAVYLRHLKGESCQVNLLFSKTRLAPMKKISAPRIQAPSQPKTGDVVIVKDNLPRGSWNLGKVHDLIQSRDAECQAARVILPSRKCINRRVNLLYPIECPETLTQEDCDVQTVQADETKSTKLGIRRRPSRRAAIEANKRLAQQLSQ
ncbi:uncharacterized protein [Ptychodera flava]|uniref:uncharacterized protein n=1 Tax=Ptychodera flava TaxID=63121 RepID=UPI00396A581A